MTPPTSDRDDELDDRKPGPEPAPESPAESRGELASSDAWLRRLAARLVDDPHTADDLAQETWLASLGSGSREPRSARSWLGAVLRNKGLDELRRRRRRERHEHLGARDDEQPSTEEFAARRSVARALHEAVDRLPPAYAQLVRRRFFDERSVADIASELERPLETVKAQLRKALALLREDLDRRAQGDRTKWMGVLVAFARRDDAPAQPVAERGAPPHARHAVRAGAAVAVWWLSRRAWVAAGAALVAIIVWVTWEATLGREAVRGDSASVLAEVESNDRAQPTGARIVEPAGEGARRRAEEATAASAPVSTAPAAKDPALPRLALRLVTPDLAPLPGTIVELGRTRPGPGAAIPFERVATSDANGRAEIVYSLEDLTPDPFTGTGERDRLVLRFSGPGYGQSDAWFVRALPDDGVERVLALDDTRADWSGSVVTLDAAAPIPHAKLTIVSSQPSPRRPGPPSTHAPLVVADRFVRECDENGRFSIARLPAGALSLRVTAPGHLVAQKEFPDSWRGRSDVRLALYRAPRIEGCVRDARGDVVAGAVLRCETKGPAGSTEARAGADGMFVLELPDELRPLEVVASDPAHPARSARTRVKPSRGERLAWDPVLVERPGVQLELVDAAGAPVPGAKVRFTRSSERARLFSSERWSPERRTDSAGRAELFDEVDDAVDALVFPPVESNEPPVAFFEHLTPREAPWRVVLPDPLADCATFSASIGADGWTLERDPTVTVCLPDAGYRAQVQLADRRIAPQRFVPGPCYVLVGCGELGQHLFGPFDLRPGQPFDAGELRLPPKGRIEWDCSGVETTQPLGWVLATQPSADGAFPMLNGHNALGTPPSSFECLAGAHVLRLARGSEEWSRRYVDVPAGGTVRIVEVPDASTALTLRVRFQGDPAREARVAIVRAAGGWPIVQRTERIGEDGLVELRAELAPGEYRGVTFVDGESEQKLHALRVPLENGAGATVELAH